MVPKGTVSLNALRRGLDKWVLTPGQAQRLSHSLDLSQSSGSLPKSLQLQLLAGSLCFRGPKICLLTSVSSTGADLFSFSDIRHSRVYNRQKLETTSMSNNRKPVTLIRVSPCNRVLSRHSQSCSGRYNYRHKMKKKKKIRC